MSRVRDRHPLLASLRLHRGDVEHEVGAGDAATRGVGVLDLWIKMRFGNKNVEWKKRIPNEIYDTRVVNDRFCFT